MVTKIVVMVGYSSEIISSTEILDVSTMTWAMGPPLPITILGNQGVESYTDTSLGLSTGGNGGSGNKRIKKIYSLQNTSDEGYTWEEVYSMTAARDHHSAVNAPTSLLPNC